VDDVNKFQAYLCTFIHAVHNWAARCDEGRVWDHQKSTYTQVSLNQRQLI